MSIYLFSPGDTIERKFSILDTLGRGSFSQVYKAEDLLMGGICVLKVLQPADAAVDSLGKLREEANIYRKLGHHKHIAQLLDTNKFTQRDDLLYLKLEYIEGKTIESYLKENEWPPSPISITETRQIILELLEALDFMHHRPEPILHRDIKPSNLILSPTRGLVVIDFNVSKELVAGEGAQTLVGTLPYIPPENISRGTDWDVTGDLYAVGVLLYKMLTNEEPPFSTRSGSSLDLSLADFEDMVPTLPSNVVEILNRAIAFRPQDRFQSAREMKEAIQNKWSIDQNMKTLAEVKDISMNKVISPNRKIVSSLAEVEDMLDKWETEIFSRDKLAENALLLCAIGDFLQTEQAVDDEMSLEEARSRFVRWMRPVLVDSVAHSESELTELKKLNLSADNFVAIQTKVRAVQTLLETAGGLRWALSDTGRALLEKGNELIKQLLYSLEHWGLFLQVAKQVEDYLREAKTLDVKTGGGAAAAALAGDADNAVKALEQNLDTSDDSWLRSEFLTLKQRVGSFYSELRSRHEIPTTATEVEPLADLIQQWCELPPETRVTYYPRLADNDVAEMNISDALNAARDRYEIAINKRIDEKYAAKARYYLQDQEGQAGQPVRQPDQAKVELARWEELPGVNKSIILSPDRKVLIEKRLKLLMEEVEKEYQKWSDADKHIGHAQGVVSVDPLEAYQEYKNALKVYAYHAAIPDLLLKIRAEAARALEGGLKAAEQATQNELWTSAREKLEMVKELIALESPTVEQQGALDRLQSLIQDYIMPLEKIDGQPHEELTLLNRLQTDYAVYWAQWDRYPARLKQLQTRQAVEGLLEDVGRLTHKEASVMDLRQLCDDLTARPELNRSSSQMNNETEKRLRLALTKVTAWLGYVQARDELGKEDLLKTFSVDEVDEIYVPVLDLTLVQKGLVAAEKDAGANDAVKSAGFLFRLNQLQTKDKEVEKVLIQVRRERSAATEPSIAKLSEWRDKLQRTRKIPSSHIREVLALYRIVQTELHEVATDCLKLLLHDHMKTYFETTGTDGRFDKSANEKLEKEIRDLQEKCGRGANDPLVQIASVVQAFTRAHRIQAQETNNWPAVKRAWDSARQFDPDELDSLFVADLEDIKRYAENQYKEAWKQTVFAETLHNTNKLEAEFELLQVCQDVILRQHWDVWYEHGNHCLIMSRHWLQQNNDDQRQQVKKYLDKAYSSLNKAQTFMLLQQANVPIEKQTAVANAVSECDGWMRVVAVDNEICKILLLNNEGNDKPIPSVDCQRAVDDYNNAIAEGYSPVQQATLRELWQRRQKAALQRLETQYPKIVGATALYDQLDNLVGRAFLQPESLQIATLIQEHFERTLSGLERDVDPARGGITFDVTGAIFRKYYQKRHKGQSPPDEQCADLQNTEVVIQQEQANTLRRALPLTQLEEASYINRLNWIDEQLLIWNSQLVDGLINPVTEAKNKANSGLCDAQHFETARYILRMPNGIASSDIARIDEKFTNHITVIWHKAYVTKQQVRQQRQQMHFDAIEKTFRREAELVPQIQQTLKTNTPVTSEQIEELEQLTTDFRQAVVHMNLMQKEEEDDACCLQSQLEYDAYYEPVTEEDDDGYYHGLVNVRRAVTRKINQYDQAVEWVAACRANYEDSRRTVSLSEAVDMVNKLGNHSKLGLITAVKFLTVVKGDDGQDRYQGGWVAEFQEHAKKASVVLPLEAAWLPGGIYENTFTLHGLLVTCQESNLKEHLNITTLFAITEAPNRKRRQLCDDIQKDIQLADAEIKGYPDSQKKGLQERIELFQEKWEQFQHAVADLYAVGWPRRRRLTEQPEWEALIEAKNDFCEICPNYAEFTQTLQDLSNDLPVRKLDCDYE